MGLFSHPIALEIQASCTGGKEKSRGERMGRSESRESKEEKVSEKVLKFCV